MMGAMGISPNFGAFEFLAADVFNGAAGIASGSIALATQKLTKPGVMFPEAVTFGIAGMVLTTGLVAPFAIEFGTGVVATAHGTVTNADTQTYSNNFASLVPASGSVVAYLSATYAQIQQNPRQIVGPPAGHPDYNPGFIAYTLYQNNVDSIALTATTTAPDGFATFEIARFVLAAGQVTLGTPDKSVAQRASGNNVCQILGGTGGIINTVPLSWAGSDVHLVIASTLTLPPVSSCTGLVFGFVNRTAALVTINAADSILGWSGVPGTAVNSFSLPFGAAVQIEGGRGFWQIKGGSLLGINGLPSTGVTATSGLFATSTVGAVVLGISANGVTNARLAQAPAFSLKGNGTAGVANVGDLAVVNSSTVVINPMTATTIGWAVPANSITNAILADMGAFTIKGNPTGGVASPVDIILQQTGTILITLGPTSINWSINPDSVGNSLLANMPAITVKGNATGGAVNPQDIGMPALRSMLGIKSYSTGNIAINSGAQFAFSHNQAALPNFTEIFLVCVSNDEGYPAGTVIPVRSFTLVDSLAQSSLNSGVVVYHVGPAYNIVRGQFGRATDVFAAPSQASGPGNTQGLTNGRWVLNIFLYWIGV